MPATLKGLTSKDSAHHKWKGMQPTAEPDEDNMRTLKALRDYACLTSSFKELGRPAGSLWLVDERASKQAREAQVMLCCRA